MKSITISLEHWYQIKTFLPSTRWKPGGPGRPPCDFRKVLEGIIWVLRSGARWDDLPSSFPSSKTCHRRFKQWSKHGSFREILRSLVQKAAKRGEVDFNETYIDGSFVPAKCGGSGVKACLKGKGSKIIAIIDRNEYPISIELVSANRHDVSQVERAIESRLTRKMPKVIIGDKGFDSDPLDKKLRRRGIELIAPDRDCKRKKTQDGRKLRKSKRRWSIERYFAHLKKYRRIAVRWETSAENYLSMVHLACICRLIGEF